ncbi:uncharacterized protein LOC109857630 isoform X2 [Pseudomyrmex gracilis]|uniref:uncharacterized protein LOC109857630 isoform X2 n=1 Tax=Pseudomyrmex gracilis TaxID=219809 RepID=UPI00099553F1|nr:uncharacterized protein LOC109857630 isoform X2 [Pseudomyrmex gracilis]
MISWFNRFLVALLCFVAVPSCAIYDPKATTTKPPERRESELPWHSFDRANESRIDSRSPKWQEDGSASKTATKSWGSWRKTPGSEIEQRTQIDPFEQVPKQIPEQILAQVPPEQQHDLKFPDERRETQKREYEKLIWNKPFDENFEIEAPPYDKTHGGNFKDESRHENRGRPRKNEIDFEHKYLSRDDKETTRENDEEDLYEGVASDSTKPRKENILSSQNKPELKVARYDSRSGVQCPERNSTGQFVYPPDCKFFVNCWKGRAHVQPCAPGTHFNPDTLECDFPHKVKCYENELADLREPWDSDVNPRKPQKLQEPKCPAYLTGLLPYHGDCTKFMQCAFGATYIMKCGPGTVFNRAIGVCDWPRNVKGCEDTFKSDQDNAPLTPPNLHSGYKSDYKEVKKVISCPADFTGLLPHPETCKKFLQCAHGATFVMDCGPGTAFNPLTTVCDWPYNVPGCKSDKSSDGVRKTEGDSWSPSRGTTSWSTSGGRYNQTDSRSHIRPSYSTTPSPTFRPTWKPLTTTSSPRWYPTARPSFNYPDYSTNYHNRYGHIREEDRYKDQGTYPSQWRPSGGGNSGRPFEGNYGFQGHHPDRQWTQHEGIDQSSQGTYPPTYPKGSWSYEHGNRHQYNREYPPPPPPPPSSLLPPLPPGYYYHPYYPYYPPPHGYESTSNLSASPNWNSARPPSDRNYDRKYDHGRYGGHNPNADDGGYWHPGHNYHHDSRYPTEYGAPDGTDQRQFQPYFPSGRYDEDNVQFHNVYNKTKFGADGNLPDNRRNDYDFAPNRQDYGRIGFYFPSYNRTYFPNSGNVFPNSANKSGESWYHTQDGSRQDRLPPSWTGQGNTARNQSDGSDVKPSTWRGQHDRGQVQTDQWDQGTVSPEDKLHRWQSGSDVPQQSTADTEADVKMQHWASRTNVFSNSKVDSGTHVYSTPFFTTTTPITPTQQKTQLSRRERTFAANFNGTRRSDLPTVSIEQDDLNSSDTKVIYTDSRLPDLNEPEIDDDHNVDVLDDKNVWKPRLVFENKTETTTETASSVIMKIGPKKIDVELFNIEAAPFHEEEPPFPVYYVHPVQPLTHSRKSVPRTPISGQAIRLRGGSGPNEGYVEVQGAMPGWGVVCDFRNSWTLKEAYVVCRQLGYVRGAEMAWQGRNNRNEAPSWIAANSVTCVGNETRFQSCKFTHNQECRVDRDAIGVRCVPNRVAHCRKDEISHEGQCYHLTDPDSGFSRAEAQEYCARRNARIIDITSQAENNFVSEWLLQSHSEVSSIMTSGFGFTTMSHTLWLWSDSAHAKFKFTKWWPGWMNETKLPPGGSSRPLCIVMKRKFPCHEQPESTCDTDYFFWHTEDCEAETKEHSLVCKRPYDDIGCIYGKGNQYVGKANVTASGKECLPWADERIAHQLRVNIVNKEVRDKLKTHNYCRNPNPDKESRTWCFTSPGKREYCDIPACGNIDPRKPKLSGQCLPKHFECMPGECIPSPWVCDGEEDCTNGADERVCRMDLGLFEKSAKHRLEGHDVEKWFNTPLKTCALRCKEADFTCRSFNHKSDGNMCLLSAGNIGLTGALKPDKQFDYYEMKERSLNCDDMYVCNNRKCINQTQVCDGKNDCGDHSDESVCTVENLDYDIRLAGANNSYEGRIEVKVHGIWGQVCDDGFGMINADVVCNELGFDLGALEIRPGGFYGNLDPPTRFMVDQLKCRGNETTLRECDFNGWGVHNCQPEEAVGVVCKTAVHTCQEGHWKCDNSPICIPTPFICDEVVDCPDQSDESPEHCDAPFELRLANGSTLLEGRVEVRHHGVWGTVCDDDFTNATATVICRSLGYGGVAVAKKDGFFGPGEGPIWLDEVFCHGNESQLYRCEHNHWGQHNCDHNEDAGVICSPGDINNAESYWISDSELSERINIDEVLPSNCGQRAKDFNDDDDLIFQKVVHGSVAPKGTYPWQASIRVRGHSRSSHWCGAVIISPLHVLTAAHCLEGYNKGTYFVRAGDYNTDIDEGTEAEANIEDYYVHEEFRKGHRMNNDIALVLLKGRGIQLGKDIMPICLPSESTKYTVGLNCTISGFGSIETGKTTQSKDLRYGWVPLLDQSICKADYVYGEGAISDGMMCAGYLDEGIDTCDGDSGGPLACHHNGAFTLYGITSWGQHCGKANKPGVYVKVAYYRRWIDQKIKESMIGR